MDDDHHPAVQVPALALLVNFAPVCDPRHTDEFCRVVDDVYHAPVTHPDAPLIFVALQLFASCWPWGVAQRFDLADGTGQHVIRQRFEFLPRGRLYLDGVIISRSRPRFTRSALIFSSGIPFSLRRDSEISPSQNSSNTAPYFFRSI